MYAYSRIFICMLIYTYIGYIHCIRMHAYMHILIYEYTYVLIYKGIAYYMFKYI